MSAKLSFVSRPVRKSRKCKTKRPESSSENSELIAAAEMMDEKNSRICKTKVEMDYALWKHVVSVLLRILVERPQNVVESFEQLSRKVKDCSSWLDKLDQWEGEGDDRVQLDILEDDREYLRAKRYLELMHVPLPTFEEKGEAEGEEEDRTDIKFDVCQQIRRFEEAGIALPKLDCFHINFAMRRLVAENPLSKIRFWGMIYGLKSNYYVVECELKPKEIAKRREVLRRSRAYPRNIPVTDRLLMLCRWESWKPSFVPPRNETEEKLAILKKRSKLKKYKPPPLPIVELAPQIPIPPERPGEGCNRKVFFVCNDPQGEWKMLPDVLPRHVAAARKIKNYFTGNIIAPVASWLGNELETEEVYLRAQIARISAATQISPLGFYTFGGGGEEEEEEEEEEEGGGRGGPTYKKYTQNRDFVPVPLRDLADPTMSFWVHHTDHILKQGRALWIKPELPKDAGEGEEEEEKEGEGEGEGGEYVEPEVGPPLLTPLSEDATLEGIPPWTVRISPKYLPKKYAVVRSNLWPGAYAYASACDFDNVYIGWGIKFQRHGFPLSTVPTIQKMYDIGPDVLESWEPTLQMEDEWHFNRLKPKPPDFGHAGEGEGHGEGKGEEEEEDIE